MSTSDCHGAPEVSPQIGRFWAKCCRRAWGSSKAHFREKLILGIVLGGLASGLRWRFGLRTSSEFIEVIAYLLGPYFIVFLVTFAWNLAREPAVIEAELDARVMRLEDDTSGLEKKIDQLNAPKLSEREQARFDEVGRILDDNDFSVGELSFLRFLLDRGEMPVHRLYDCDLAKDVVKSSLRKARSSNLVRDDLDPKTYFLRSSKINPVLEDALALQVRARGLGEG